MDNVGEEQDGLFGADVGVGSSLDPRGKFVDGYQQMRVSPRRRLEGPHKVDDPNRKWLGYGDHL